MGLSSKVVRPEEVLESLKNDGTIDALRMKIIAQLKANVRMHLSLSFNPLVDKSPVVILVCILVSPISRVFILRADENRVLCD
jgi:hypothetical protein